MLTGVTLTGKTRRWIRSIQKGIRSKISFDRATAQTAP